MLRIIASQSAGQAQSYYTTADYYTEGQELVGRWQGRGAERLGLAGLVQPDDWNALCENRHPATGERLTPRTRADRRIGYDFNFHVPKSVSLLQALTEDDRILDAFRESVRETMTEMETEMQCRVRKAGQNEDRVTGNMVWGEFIHLTARPVDGVPDPHLHAHCFVFSETWDETEQTWKAGQFGDLKRDAPYFEGRFHLRLAEKLTALGLPIERTKTGWENAGFDPSLLDKFSRRTRAIEAEAERKGISDPEQKSALGAKTRSRKQKDLTMPELRAEWTSRLTDDERAALTAAGAQLGQPAPIPGRAAVAEAVSRAADHLFERKSVLPERRLLAEAFHQAVGTGGIAEVEGEYQARPWLTRERQGQRLVTLPTILAEESKMLAFARQGRGTCVPLKRGPHRFERDWLNDGQRRAVHHVLHSSDRVILIRGAAGVGKTSMMQEAVAAIEATGRKVFTLAPSAKASRGVLRDKGFSSADTVSRFLIDERWQASMRGEVLWIDEAGMVGTRTMAKVFQLAEQLEARVILSGDRRQHGSVERGAALRLLEEQAGLVPAEIKEIQRQRDQYKLAVRALSEERIADGFQKLNQLGWIREVPFTERYGTLAVDYVATVTGGETALVVSPTHLEAERCTDAIRTRLKHAGLLARESRPVATLHRADLTEGQRRDAVNYSAGDVLIFHQNAQGFTKGERVTVGTEPPPIAQAARFQVFHPGMLAVAIGDVLRITQNGRTADGLGRLHNGDLVHVTGFDQQGNLLTAEQKTIASDFGHLAYGYVTTSYGSQGTDVDKVLIGQSAASFLAASKEQFYVSVSRGKRQAMIYTDCKADLLAAVQQSDERLSATELFHSRSPAERSIEPVVEREATAQRAERVYER
jgi:conjugative relaxase-like TrwC/TraI family protein